MRSSEREEVEIEDQQSVLKVEGLKAPHDICLVVGENRYPAHRVVLSARSEVFQCMLLNPQYKECKETEIQLTEEPENVFVFPQFLKYICTGEVEIAIESALPLMTLADKYDIKDLITSCRSFMAKNIAMAGSEGFLISWLQYTILFDVHKQLTDELKNFLSLNIGIVGYSKDFVDISPKNLAVLLQQNDLVVKNEATLFEIVENWLMIKLEQIKLDESCSDDEKGTYMNSLFKEICVHIRFPMMSIRELTNICLKPITAFSKNFFDDQISLAMSFHAGKPFRDEGNANEVNLQFTPRLYTSDVYCLEMNVDGIHNIDNYENSSANFSSLSKFPYTSDGKSELFISQLCDYYFDEFQRVQLVGILNFIHSVFGNLRLCLLSATAIGLKSRYPTQQI